MEAELKELTVGPWTFKLTKQAMAVVYLWVVILASMLLTFFFDNSTMLVMRVVTFVLYVPLAVLSVYAVNCYVVGECNILAWVAVALLALSALGSVFSTVVLVLAKQVPVPLKKLTKRK